MIEVPKTEPPECTPITVIKDRDFPGLYQSADAASLLAQNVYFVLQKIHLASLLIGAIIAAFTTLIAEQFAPQFYAAIAIILVVGVIVMLVSRSRRDDKVWFDCRAIAESTKTAAWRFMMRAAPFADDSDAKQLFVSELQEIREARPFSLKDLATNIDPNAQSISNVMNDVRSKSLDERRSLYIEARLRDQKKWYSSKATFNSSTESCWFWWTTGLQTLAVVLAIVEAVSGGFQVNVVPILLTCAAAAVAWSQMKRHSELAQTYSLAAQELGDQESIAEDITEEKNFLSLVDQVEETISREHTMWCARRDTVLKLNKRETRDG